jgi:hypothetical protein
VTLNRGRTVHYPYWPESGFVPDPGEVASLVTPRTRAIVIINPNNPTGAVYPRAVLEALAQHVGYHRVLAMEGANLRRLETFAALCEHLGIARRNRGKIHSSRQLNGSRLTRASVRIATCPAAQDANSHLLYRMLRTWGSRAQPPGDVHDPCVDGRSKHNFLRENAHRCRRAVDFGPREHEAERR